MQTGPWLAVGQTGQASLWRGQKNIVLQVRTGRRSRLIPSVGIWPIVFLPVTQDWHSWRWLSSLVSPAPDHCYSPAWPMRAQLTHLGHIRPVSRQSGSDLSSSLLHHNNIFPSLPCSAPAPASDLLMSGIDCCISLHIAFPLSPCYYRLFLSKVKRYFLNANDSIWSLELNMWELRR